MLNLDLPSGMYDLTQLKFAIINSNATPNTWQAITSQVEQMTAAEVAQVVGQVDGVTFARNAAGDVIGAWVDTGASTLAPAELGAITEAAAINSNTVSAAARTATVMVPQNAAVNATTGAVELSAGATKVATGTKIATAAGHVGTWVLGAGIGMKLGVWIDGGLYNINPDFWDSHNMQYLNPERWNESKVTNWLYDYSGYDDFMALIDEDGQPYVDENLYALTAQYLANRGAFSQSTTDVTLDDTSPLFYPNNYVMPVQLTSIPVNVRAGAGLAYVNKFSSANEQGAVYCALLGQNNDSIAPYFFSEAPFTVVSEGVYPGQIDATAVTRNGETFYVWMTSNPFGLLDGVRNPGTIHNECGWDFMYMMKHGTVHHSGIEGINQYDTVPTGITDQMTPEQIIQLLKQQYPHMWDDAIKQGTLNDDGTITERTYLPIAVPTGGTEGQPETDPDYPGEPDPDNVPQTQYINKIIQKSPTPPQTPEDPDTGTGTTPTAPAPSGSANALYKIYNPTNAQIQSFGAWLWSSNFVDQLLKVFNDPMQAIISLHKIYATPHTGGTANIRVGYLDSGVSSKYVDEQYIDVDCGSVDLYEVRSSVLDYEPFVDVRLYLPFIGIVNLSTADVMRGKIGVKYRIDVITGTLVAFVSVNRDMGTGGVIYQYTGSCCEAYPLSSGSYMGILTGVLGIAAGVAGTIATGGAAAPALLGGAAGLSAMHTKVEHSNGFSGNAGALACKKPYLIISRQQSALSGGIAAQGGYPANTLVQLNQCKGFTKVRFIHLQSIKNATDYEHDEIIRLLTDGVII